MLHLIISVFEKRQESLTHTPEDVGLVGLLEEVPEQEVDGADDLRPLLQRLHPGVQHGEEQRLHQLLQRARRHLHGQEVHAQQLDGSGHTGVQ